MSERPGNRMSWRAVLVLVLALVGTALTAMAPVTQADVPPTRQESRAAPTAPPGTVAGSIDAGGPTPAPYAPTAPPSAGGTTPMARPLLPPAG